MQRTPVVSSNIASVGYELSTQTLEVEFQGGSVWRYANVPAEVANNLMEAESVGKFFNANVKGKYTSTQL
jgi:hypothetical protein